MEILRHFILFIIQQNNTKFNQPHAIQVQDVRDLIVEGIIFIITKINTEKWVLGGVIL